MAGTVVFLEGLGLNRDDTDEDTLLLSLKLPNDSNGVATSLAFCRHVLVTTHLFTTNHCEGLDRMTLAKCESALRQYVHREYFLAAVEGRQGSRQRTNFQARWMVQSDRVGAVYLGRPSSGAEPPSARFVLRRQQTVRQ